MVERVAHLQAMTCGVLERHDPAKLPKLGGLFVKHAGDEADIYLHACLTCGEVPMPIGPAT